MDSANRPQPSVTVVIPAFNSEETLDRAIVSVLEQTCRPHEIIVVDDASRDRTSAVAQAWAKEGVKLVRLDEQRGASGARNAGISAASGELIAFLDSDDEWLPSKLEKQTSLILSNEYVFVSCAAREFSPTGEDRGDLYKGARPAAGTECWKSLLARNTVATPSVLVWRKHLLDVQGFDESLRFCEDQDMWIRLACRGAVGFVNEWLVKVNSRMNSLSTTISTSSLWVALDVVERHLSGQQHRLTARELRTIRSERLAWIGRAECNDNYWRGFPIILRALAMGYRPVQTAMFLVSASPPVGRIKSRLYRKMGRRKDTGTPSAPDRHRRHPMLPANDGLVVRFSPTERPRLVVIVDAEEEFDWAKPLTRENQSVNTMVAQLRAHAVFQRFGVVPTYAIDYPVVMHEAGYGTIMQLLDAGKCEIGAQLHPWVTPPFDEEISESSSYPGNLPRSLERRKLQTLTSAISDRFGVKPRLYRAGRYGAGAATASILAELGYDADCSVVPGISQWSRYAPDYAGGDAHPYWLETDPAILELPVTVGSLGIARHLGEGFYRGLHLPSAKRLRLSGIMARSGLLNRVRLSPEGSTLRECKHLTRFLHGQGYRYFAISYHSPSLEPGHTPYVRTRNDLERFLHWIEGYLEFFLGELNGIPETTSGVFAWARANSVRPVKPRFGYPAEAAAAR
jgi:glycosyltransferase involved in cell wall biosynthesis